LIETLLTPTNIYVKTYKKFKPQIQAMAHITGGGLVENLPRVLPENLRAVIKGENIRVLPIFDLIGKHVARDEMFRAFNMGVGMVLVVRPEDAATILDNSEAYEIGEITEGKREAVIV
jgi:phosphoribosylformylglycinamidine cyclo-ligase